MSRKEFSIFKNHYKGKLVVKVNITVLWLVTLYSLVTVTVSPKALSNFNRIHEITPQKTYSSLPCPSQGTPIKGSFGLILENSILQTGEYMWFFLYIFRVILMVPFSYHCFSVFIVILRTFSFVKGTCRDNVDNRVWYGFCLHCQFDRKKLQKCRSQPKDMRDEYDIPCLSGLTFTACQGKV
jgi:hypothetical protein